MPAAEFDPEATWIGPAPRPMATEVIAGFAERFARPQDDLRALTTPLPVIAKGWVVARSGRPADPGPGPYRRPGAHRGLPAAAGRPAPRARSTGFDVSDPRLAQTI